MVWDLGLGFRITITSVLTIITAVMSHYYGTIATSTILSSFCRAGRI